MERQQKRVYVETLDLSDFDRKSLSTLQTYLAEAQEEAPKGVVLMLDYNRGWEDEHDTTEVYYDRPETDEEMEARRLRVEAQQRQQVESLMRQLQAKGYKVEKA